MYIYIYLTWRLIGALVLFTGRLATSDHGLFIKDAVMKT
jgi:hypothetical protein